jgi:putative NIF3 family GTP cyclohydrolase 1 type 2
MITQQQIYDFLKNEYFPPIPKWIDLDGSHETFHSNNPYQQVQKILLCVTCGRKIKNHAKENQYDLVIAHHPIHIDFPHMYFHLSMDFAKKMSQNIYFAKTIGLENINIIGDSYAYGELLHEITYGEFRNYLNECGYKIKKGGFEIHCKDKLIRTVCFVSGLGTYAFTDSWIGTDRPTLHNVEADIFVTGQLIEVPPNHKFNHILEIGHTNSEKPIFKWIRDILKNKFKELQIDIVNDSLEGWDDEIV